MKLGSLIFFAAGAAIGAAVTWYCVKKTYENRAQEQIESVKDSYYKRLQTLEQAKSLIAKDGAKTEKAETHTHVISPLEFAQPREDYECIELVYYRDNVLADDGGEPMSDEEIERVVGRDSLNHFGEWENDSVFVRNDELKCYYSIILDPRRYKEIK